MWDIDDFDDDFGEDDSWLVFNDFVTNCDEREVPFYKEASIQTHIPVIIEDDAVDCKGRWIPGYRAISIPRECRPKDCRGYSDLTDFWTVFDEIKKKRLMPLI